MTTNPILVLISLKTLRPEVEDYWLSIPSVLKTIDALKLYVMTNESIDSCGADADDIGLYLNSGLLRDNTSIDGVLRDRDRIEVRVKPVPTEPWISSSSATAIEPVTVDESDDPSVVWTLEMSRILSGITSAEELRFQYLRRRQDRRPSDPIGDQTQANSDRQLSTHSSASVAAKYSAIRPIRQSAKKVVTKAVTRRVSDGKVGNQSKGGKNQIFNENSVPEVTGHEFRRSTTGQRSRNQLKPPPPPSNRKRLNDSSSSGQPMATDWSSPQLLATTSAANRPATGVTQSGDRCLTTSITIATEDRPETSWSASGLSRRQRCEAPGCGYSSQSRVAFQYHQRIHRLKSELFGDSSIFKDIVAKHHFISDPSVSPEIPLTRCPHEGYLILTEDPFVLSN
ncbi:unnamed protein product [Medioppia subpectinata]|uniref:Uncharacterized protein n=1 Tax=Medioppia subpectinata TaxID=1979941 RepID=A0A7R9KGL7_9ACAR|nr:unnamed protein product [Medioppia subpectinata]CAG2102217.1 unnamed protein product [Medioppia subpectinata]